MNGRTIRLYRFLVKLGRITEKKFLEITGEEYTVHKN